MENENEYLRKNVKDLQGQLRQAHIRISKLSDIIYELKKKINPFDKSLSINGGWAEMERWVNENPDASHIDKNQLNLKLNEDKENEK